MISSMTRIVVLAKQALHEQINAHWLNKVSLLRTKKLLLRELDSLPASSGLISLYVLQCGGDGPALTTAL